MRTEWFLEIIRKLMLSAITAGALALSGLLIFACIMAATAPSCAHAAPVMQAGPGAMCTHITDRYSTKSDRLTLESVRVLELAPLPSGQPGAWVMPVAGPMAWAQFHVSQASLTECQP